MATKAKAKIQVKATKVKDTKGAVMFLADDPSPITNLYLRREGWDAEVTNVIITVEEV